MSAENEMTQAEFNKLQKKLKREKWENMFTNQLHAIGFTQAQEDSVVMPGEYAREFRFHPSRRWRVDFLIVYKHHPLGEIQKCLVEIEGATYAQGRHTRGSGFAKDCEKYNHVNLAGWDLFRFTGEMVRDGYAIKWLQDNVFCFPEYLKGEKTP